MVADILVREPYETNSALQEIKPERYVMLFFPWSYLNGGNGGPVWGVTDPELGFVATPRTLAEQYYALVTPEVSHMDLENYLNTFHHSPEPHKLPVGLPDFLRKLVA
jgi:hypothetical protein